MLWWTLALAAPFDAGPREVEGPLPDERGDDDLPYRPPRSTGEDAGLVQVVGGRQVEPGEYPDAVGLVFAGSYVGCTGTLVAPNVVVTAAHCIDGIPVTDVLVDSRDWIDGQGELVPVAQAWAHPSYDPSDLTAGYDFGVLLLAEDSNFPHRVIARGCLLDQLYNGAPAAIVGFGRTREDGGGWNSAKNVGFTAIRDDSCAYDELNGFETGCADALRPGGELIAGGRIDIEGDGEAPAVDACFGDSGGPLYLDTSFGEYLVGVTSRGMSGVSWQYPCRDGGIWVRPDALIDFIEERTGVVMDEPTCNQPPVVRHQTLFVQAGRSASLRLDIEDVDSDRVDVELIEGSDKGEARVRGQRVRFKADREALGRTSVWLAVTDSPSDYPGSLSNTVLYELDVMIEERSCGCAAAAGPAGWLPLGGLLLGLLARRRRR